MITLIMNVNDIKWNRPEEEGTLPENVFHLTIKVQEPYDKGSVATVVADYLNGSYPGEVTSFEMNHVGTVAPPTGG